MRVHLLTPSQLDAEASRLPLGHSFFASIEFARLWESLGGSPFYLGVQDAGEWAGVLPAVAYGRGALRRLQSMPDGCYGGVLVASGLEASAAEAVRAAALEALLRERWCRIHLVDFGGKLRPSGHFREERRETRLVDIRDPDWIPEDKKLQSQIRSAERNGLQIEPFDWATHGEGFLRLMRATARRHGRAPVHGSGFYRALSRLASTDDRVRWIWCSLEGRPLCSHIYFREGDFLQGWQIQFEKSASRFKPNQYVRYSMCRQMAREGCTHLNLGSTPKGAEGLTYYKRRWGGERRAYSAWVYRGVLARLLRR